MADTPPTTPESKPQRAASVSLDQGPKAEQGALLDPAHQSLADALKITMRIVQFAMIGLVAFFLFSGAQQVNEGETGVRLVFGEVVEEDLNPGFTFSWPFPIGELYKVETGAVSLRLEDDFFPQLSDKEKQMSINQITRQNVLKPGVDNYAVTSDQSLIHMQWRINYRRTDASEYVRTIRPEEEQPIVRAIAKRAIVREVAATEIDSILIGGGGGGSSLSRRVRISMQEMLDDIGAGIIVESADIDERTPPLFARDAFELLQTASSNRQKAIDKAEGEARSVLTATAGDLAQEVIDAIDEYVEQVNLLIAAEEQLLEILISQQDPEDQPEAVRDELERQADEARTRIAELEGPRDDAFERVKEIMLAGDLRGEAGVLINAAKTYRRTIVTRREQQFESYRARTTQYSSDKRVAMSRDWNAAMKAFFDNNENVEFFAIPSNLSELRIRIDRDKQLARELATLRKRRLAEQAEDERYDLFDQSQYEVDLDRRIGEAQ